MMKITKLGQTTTDESGRPVVYKERGPGIAWVFFMGVLGLSLGWGVGHFFGLEQGAKLARRR